MYTAAAFIENNLKTKLTKRHADARLLGHDTGALRHPDTVIGTVMTNKEVNEALTSPDRELLINCTGVAIISNEKAFFLTDDHCFGHNILPKGWCPMSVRLPLQSVPRPGLETGIIRTAEDLILVFCQGERQINSLDELVEYLNSEEG